MSFLKNSLLGYVILFINTVFFLILYLILNPSMQLDLTAVLISWGVFGVVSSLLQSYLASKMLNKPEVFKPILITTLVGTLLIPIIIYLVSIPFSAYIYNEKQG